MGSSKVGFIILTVLQIPSFYAAIHLFYQYFQPTSPLRRIQNHVLMCLLVISTWTISIELPNTQKYLWTGSISIYTSWFCTLWNMSFWSTATLNRILMAFMCIERHFLVFCPRAYHTHRSRVLFHYIPLIIIIIAILIYELITNFFISCPQMNFNYSLFMCGYTCTVLSDRLGTFYTWVSVFIPTIITIIGCVLLPIRFIIQKRTLQQVQWHRARKMIVQTSIIAGVYTICWLPYCILLQLLLNNYLSFYNSNVIQFLAVAPYMTSLLTPFIVFHTVQKPINLAMIEEMKRRFCPQRQAVVQPLNNSVPQQNNPSAQENHTSAGHLKIVKNAVSYPLKSQ